VAQAPLDIETLFGPEVDERDLIAIARELGAEDVRGWSDAEYSLLQSLPRVNTATVQDYRARIRAGEDPLGELFCKLRTRAARRERGATYTPSVVVKAMLYWCSVLPPPARVVDPGCGSARFLTSAAGRFPHSALVGIEIDPLACILSRANLATRGLSKRSEVRLADFREIELVDAGGPTLFIGNPPYVRHHLIEPRWKSWLSATAADLGLPASQLCGLHLYFFLRTVLLAKAGDYGAYITAAEWMDVNYGELLRKLAIGRLGVRSLTVIEPTAQPFPNAATTASIASFIIGAKPKTINFYRVADATSLERLVEPKRVSIARLDNESRWTIFTRRTARVPKDYIELGELCRVHRGQVTGANSVWVVDQAAELPSQFLFPTITRARELFDAGACLQDSGHLRRVVDLPVDLGVIDEADRRMVNAFLANAKAKGADRGYVAENRRAWWSVGLRAAAPILCTYMARRPPAFVENTAKARHINIAHGLYPRETFSRNLLRKLVGFLSKRVSINLGRTYAGGLTKFEPSEIERIPIPDLPLLWQMAI